MTLAAEVMEQSRLSFDKKEIAVAQRTYTSWTEGVSIDFPKDWPDTKVDGYSVVFRNAGIPAFYGYRTVNVKRGWKAARVRDEVERREHLRNELSAAGGAPAREVWAATRSTDVAAGKYTLTRDGQELVRRIVVLVQDARGIVVEGEAPKSGTDAFEAVFDRMWPTTRLQTPDREGAAAITKAINDGIERAKTGHLFPPEN